MANTRFSRRHFFYGALLAGAIPAGGFGRIPSLRRLGYKSPNEKLNVAAIGVGGRAEQTIPEFDSENLVAFADPDWDRGANVFRWYEKVPRYKDYRKMFDKQSKDIDAVIITTPDHTHTPAAMWAMEREKHVYVEKPLARTVWETRLLRDAAAKYGVATQMGNQGYSADGERIASEIVWSGEIGNVTEVHAWTNRPVWPQGIETLPPEEKVPETLDWDVWLGTARARPYSSAYVPFNWRGWFDFGCGALGDMACHMFGAVNMALRLGAPASVETTSQEAKNPYTFSKKSTTRFEFPARGGMAPVKIFWYDGATGPAYVPKGIPEDEPISGGLDAFGAGGARVNNNAARERKTATPQRGRTAANDVHRPGANSMGVVWVGDKGLMTTDVYGMNVRLLPLSRHKEYQLPPQMLSRSPGHFRDWVRACKGGEPACSNFNVSAPFTEWVLLGVIALRFQGKLEWDAENMKFTNNAEANKYLTPTMRKGWEIGSI